MSRPQSHRSMFVGAAWFAALLSLCVVALDPSLIGRTRPRANDQPERQSTPRSRIKVDRPEMAGLRRPPTAPQSAPNDGQSRLTARPTPMAAPDPPPAVPALQPQSGPSLPPPDLAETTAAARLPAPLRGLDALTELRIEVIAPVSAIEGEPAPFVIRVQNPTTIAAAGVTLIVSFDERWELPGSEDLSVEQRLGTVPPGEAREVTIALRPLESGALSAEFKLVSETHLECSRSARAEVDPRVVDFEIAGPRRRSIEQRAEFVLTVRNTSEADLPDARVDVEFDAAVLSVREASTGFVAGSGSLAWPLGTLYRGERVQIQIEYECAAETVRSAIGGAFSTGGRVLRASGTNLEIVPANTLDIAIIDSDDPWTVGRPARFLINVSNRGTQAIQNLQLRVSASPHFESLTTVVADGGSGFAVTGDAFGTLIRADSLAPGARVELTATATCVMPGNGVLRVLAQSPSLTAPFEVEESAVVNAPLPAD